MNAEPSIAIIGAGIGGLSAAAALQQRGFVVTVFEQAEALGEVGAGLTISANAALALGGLGLTAAFETLEPPTPSLGVLDWQTGARLSYEVRDLAAYKQRFGALTRHVHRADLHALLAAAAGRDSVHAGHALTGLEETADGVQLTFANGHTARFDLVIACDGLKSVVRQRHFASGEALFSGFVAWRGLVDRTRVPQVSLDPHFATYPTADRMFARYPVRGGALVNYVAIARKPDFRTESWTVQAEVGDVLAGFDGWNEDVLALIAATPADRCMCWALYTRQPLDCWTTARVALLGDAAHPMTPFYGMGAAMAIEDAYVLARCLDAERGDPAQGLARYQTARLARGNMMLQISLAKAEEYMGVDPADRQKLPGDGLADIMSYNPLTAPI